LTLVGDGIDLQRADKSARVSWIGGCPCESLLLGELLCRVEYLYTKPLTAIAANATLAHTDIIFCNKDNHSMSRVRKNDPTVTTQVAAVGRATRLMGARPVMLALLAHDR